MKDDSQKVELRGFSRFLFYVIGFILWLILKIVFFSCRKKTFGRHTLDDCLKEHKGMCLSGTWHRTLLYSIFMLSELRPYVIVSISKDAAKGVPFLRMVGCRVIRGSGGKGKGGKEALKEFIYRLGRGNFAGVALDGSQGPKYDIKYGIIAAAAKTGIPIVTTVWAARPCFILNTWDKFIIPAPFSKIVTVFDPEPMYIPRWATPKQIENYRHELNQRLVRLTYQVNRWFDLKKEYPDPRDIPTD